MPPPYPRSRWNVVRIQMVAPDPTGYRCEASEVSALFNGSGGPLNKLRKVTIGADYTSIELEFELIHLHPRLARELIVDEVRRRASMHPRLVRWVLRASPPTMCSVDSDSDHSSAATAAELPLEVASSPAPTGDN